MANIQEYNSAGLDRTYWAANNAAGYPAGAAGTLANGADASLARIQGSQSFNLPTQPPRQVNVPGDDSIQSIYLFPPEQLANGDMVLGNINLALWAKSQGIKVYADGVYSGVAGQPDSPTFNNLTFVTNAQAKSAQSGSVGNPGFRVKFFPRIQMFPIGDQGQSAATAAGFSHTIVANVSDKLPWGAPFSLTNHGTTRAAFYEIFSDYRVCLHTHISDASDTGITLAYTPAGSTADYIQVWRNGTLLTITTDWSVSGSTITLVSAGTAGDVVIIRYSHV